MHPPWRLLSRLRTAAAATTSGHSWTVRRAARRSCSLARAQIIAALNAWTKSSRIVGRAMHREDAVERAYEANLRLYIVTVLSASGRDLVANAAQRSAHRSRRAPCARRRRPQSSELVIDPTLIILPRQLCVDGVDGLSIITPVLCTSRAFNTPRMSEQAS
ncbi:hypothetical protein EXIGLDRAFT_196904 [Exidia glandulosa HHB12029]|uniref:Uncharacterized protein n=1 Tax=Exidia glandulosa HHB12029 TaxID=1314781 RepID=A0A165ETI6_EXIGL|nr:hypothetical protein EXIGLDRAFT_196904 [Exidia glandulosa HHB12029]